MPLDQGASSDLIFTKQPDMSMLQVTSSKMKNSGSGPKYATSPMPVDLRYFSALIAMLRGSREYGSFVIGSTMLQMIDSVGSAMNGSMTAVSGSGITSMSEALMACQPRIDDPSNPSPSSNTPSVSSASGIEKCCQ